MRGDIDAGHRVLLSLAATFRLRAHWVKLIQNIEATTA